MYVFINLKTSGMTSKVSSFFSVLSVLLWPLVVYHELIQRMYTGLEPILMKLDYSMKGDTEHRKHDKRSKSTVISVRPNAVKYGGESKYYSSCGNATLRQ